MSRWESDWLGPTLGIDVPSAALSGSEWVRADDSHVTPHGGGATLSQTCVSLMHGELSIAVPVGMQTIFCK